MELKSYLVVYFLLLTSLLSAQTNILITSPKGYSERFKDVFEESQLSPIAIPMIETVVPQDMPDIDKLLGNIRDYEYIAFSSRKAIESFYQKWNQNRIDISHIKFCAIGKDTEYMIEKLGVVPAVYPDEPSPMGIANKLGEERNIKGKKIAVLVPEVKGIDEPDVVPDFLARLNETGMNVTRINAYITRTVDESEIEKAIYLISTKEVKCVAFTSSAEVEILLQHIEDKNILNDVAIACFGPYTSAFAQKKGLDVAIVAKDFGSFSGFLTAIEKFFSKKTRL